MMKLPTMRDSCRLTLPHTPCDSRVLPPCKPAARLTGRSACKAGRMVVLARSTGGAWSSSLAVSRSNRQDAGATALRLYEHFNRRNTSALLDLFAQDCTYEGLAYSTPVVGKRALAEFFQRTLQALDSGIQFQVEDSTAGSDQSAAIMWQLTLDNLQVPFGKGITFVRINREGLIWHLREAPEHALKLSRASLPALSLTAPAFRGLASVLRPQQNLFASPPTPISQQATTLQQAAAAFSSPREPAQSSFRAPAGSQSALEVELERVRGERDDLEARLKSLLASGRRPSPEVTPKSVPAMLALVAGQSMPPTPPTPPPTPAMIALPARQQQQGQPPVLAYAGEGGGNSRGREAGGVRRADQGSPKDRLAGVWVKDEAASDTASYARALDVMKLGALQRTTALRLIEGLEITSRGPELEVSFLTVVPYFKITERFSTVGETSFQRRDLRGGQQRATLRELPDGVQMRMSWGPNYPGSLEESFRLVGDSELQIRSTVSNGVQTENTLQVYRRQERWVPRNKFTPEAFGLRFFTPWSSSQ